ncbi:MAG: hypothetical protein K6E62_10685 [Lachnospiraceae bacterium]|nr:hypothetical protein [Lachnospiraceae bacterium]
MQEKKFDPLELIKQILVFLAISATVFGWSMLMLLIVSFVALSYITLKLKWMIIISLVIMACVDAAYIIGRIQKKRQADMKAYGITQSGSKSESRSESKNGE